MMEARPFELGLMPRSIAVAVILVWCAPVLVAQDLGTITGTVRDTAGAGVAEAEVLLAGRRVLSTPQGTFRLDSVPLGAHLITVRRPGFIALRSRMVVRRGSWDYDYVLQPAASVLPTLTVEARRTGIYGTVGDSGLRPLPGVKVQLAGKGGGETITDSSGRFAFSGAGEGQYAVRTDYPGHAPEQLFVELKRGEGVELAFRLRHSRKVVSRAEQVAIHDLGRRLVMNLRNDRLSTGQLERYGSLGLCDLTGIVGKLRLPPEGTITIIVNGSHVMEGMPVRALCAWQAGEVELVEFGENVCRDVTRTLVDLLQVWCTRFNERARTARGRLGTQKAGMPFVVIWERQ
jgi:hypothetical protein